MIKKTDKCRNAVPGCVELLSVAGIPRMGQLLGICSSSSGREALVKRSGVNEALLLQWVKMVEMHRHDGGAGRHIELLQITGVDELKRAQLRNAEHVEWKGAGVGADPE